MPAAWLTRAASRVCLNVLSSARWRRETYVGPWLPEPVPTRALRGLSTVGEAITLTTANAAAALLGIAVVLVTVARDRRVAHQAGSFVPSSH